MDGSVMLEKKFPQKDTPVSTGQLIIPCVGKLTKSLIEFSGSDPNNAADIAVQTVKILDGLERYTQDYSTAESGEYFFAQAAGTLGSPDYPVVGLKIHVTLKPDDPDFLAKFLSIARLCAQPNQDGKRTSLKVRKPHEYYDLMELKTEDAKYGIKAAKYVVIYPNFLSGSPINNQVNVAETIRIVQGLREILGPDDAPYEKELAQEHKSGPGIFIRPGALDERGLDLENEDRSSSFRDMMWANLRSRLTKRDSFIKEVDEAIASDLL